MVDHDLVYIVEQRHNLRFCPQLTVKFSLLRSALGLGSLGGDSFPWLRGLFDVQGLCVVR